MMVRFRHLLVVLVLCIPCRASAQATLTVPPTDPVYRDIDRLIAHRLIEGVMVGQRPLSRRELARLIARACSALSDLESRSVASAEGGTVKERSDLTPLRSLVDALSDDYAWELRALADSGRPTSWQLRALDRIGVDFTHTSNSARRIPTENGLGAIDAWIAPFASDRQGRILRDGEHLAEESSHSLQSRHLAFGGTYRVAAEWDSAGRNSRRGSIQNLQVRLFAGNVAIELGREYLAWGQGRDVGLLASDNAPALDLIKLSNESLLTLPWILRRLGPTRAAVFYADLGKHQNFPGAYLVGYKVSVLPAARLELGVTVYTKAGGHGSPRASFTSRVVDAFPFLQAAFYNNLIGTRNQGEFSDRYAGVDGRLRFPGARGLQLFGELLMNDFDVRRLSSVLWEDAGHVAGVVVPRLGRSEQWTLSSELHHTGIRYYRHHQYTSGQTLDQTLIGDPLGPDALGFYSTLEDALAARRRFSVTVAAERRSNDQYTGVARPGGGLAFQRTAVRPKEVRYRAVSSLSIGPARGQLGVVTQLGLEHTRNFAFQASHNRTGTLARIGIEYRPR